MLSCFCRRLGGRNFQDKQETCNEFHSPGNRLAEISHDYSFATERVCSIIGEPAKVNFTAIQLTAGIPEECSLARISHRRKAGRADFARTLRRIPAANRHI